DQRGAPYEIGGQESRNILELDYLLKARSPCNLVGQEDLFRVSVKLVGQPFGILGVGLQQSELDDANQLDGHVAETGNGRTPLGLFAHRLTGELGKLRLEGGPRA